MAEIGTTLREARMRARIDISEVESQTKIRAKYLRAIENEEWDLLPGQVYVKSFLRTYGDFLGLDSRLLIDEFKRRYERDLDHEVRPMGALGRERGRFRRSLALPPWALVAVVLVAIVAALYALGSGASNNKTTPPAGSRATTHHRAHRARRAGAAPAAASKPGSVTLQLVPTGRVYVCLVNGRGKVLIPGEIFTTGRTIPTETAGKLLLTLGNNSVQMKVNGNTVNVPASGTSIGFLLQPSGTSSLPPAQQPRCA
jgi:cytoskeletal protein RodZ